MNDPSEGTLLQQAPTIGEDSAAPSELLFGCAAVVVQAVRRALDDPRCRLIWSEGTYGRVFSLAALSHQCLYLEHIAGGVEEELPTPIMALLVRHLLETWFAGTYLLLGGDEALGSFLGAVARAQEAQRTAVQQLQGQGSLTDLDLSLFEYEGFDWLPKRWNLEAVARHLDEAGRSAGILEGAQATYAIVYRSLSGTLGAHPTGALLEKYIDTSRFFARVDPVPVLLPTFRRAALQLSTVLTALHAQAALAERGIDVEALTLVLTALRSPTAVDD